MMRRNQQIDVKGTIALASTFHFLYACARACALPFLTLYLRHLSLTPTMTGIIMATRHLVLLLGHPLGCVLVRLWGRRRALVAGSLLGSAGAALVLRLIPSTGQETLTSHCNLSLSPPRASPAEDMWGSRGGGVATTASSQTALLSQIDVNTTLFKKTFNSTTSVLIGNVTYSLIQVSIKEETSQPSFSPQPHPSQPPLSQPHSSRPPLSQPHPYQPLPSQPPDSQPPISEPHPFQPPLTQPHPFQPSLTQPSLTHSPLTQPHLSQPLLSQPHNSQSGSKEANSMGVSAGNSRPAPLPPPSMRRGRALKRSNEELEVENASFEFLGRLKVMDAQHQLFFLLLIVLSLWEACSSLLEWTLEDGLHEYLDFVDASDRYSNSGLWGLLGGACGVAGAGLLVRHLDCLLTAHTSTGAVHFYFYAALTAVALPLVAVLPLHLHRKHERSSRALKALQLVRADAHALLCAATVFLAGVTQAALDDFLLWAMEDQGSGEPQMGLTLGLGLLSRATFPLLGPRLSRKLNSGRLLILGLGCLALQSVWYSLLWSPWSALPAQVLCCLSSGALWWAVEVQVSSVALPGVECGVRRLYQALALDFGGGLGSLAGGVAVQNVGVAWMLRGAALMLAVWCLCLPLLQWKAPRQRRINYSRLLAAADSEFSESESEQEPDWLEKAMEDDRSNNNWSRRTAL